MTDLLLKETTQLLNEVADVDLLYYFHKDNIFMFRKFNLPVLICKYRIYGPAPQIC